MKEQCQAAHKAGGYEGKSEVIVLGVDMTKREELDGVLGKLGGKKVDMWVFSDCSAFLVLGDG